MKLFIFVKITFFSNFSCINARLEFDSEILSPIVKQSDCNKINVNKIFITYKRKDLKVIYRLKLDGEENYSERSMISKIMKLDKSNHYCFALTKQQPTGCFNQQRETPYLKISNLMT